MILDVYTVSAFSKDGTGGNKAGVALLSSQMSENKKTQIACQLGYSETAFVSQSERADFKLEYFTPMGEVALCGHATIGTFILLLRLKMLIKSAYTIETKSGILNIKIEQENLIYMEQNTPKFYEILNKFDMKDCFQSAAIGDLPIQIVSTGLKDILLPIKNTWALENMAPVFSEISKISKEKDCVGIHAFSLIKDTELTAICRNFAPLYGIDEEAATGTSNGALACYLFKYGLKQSQYIFEQGYNLRNISKIYVKIEHNHDSITRVYVGGDGYLIGKESILISKN